MKRAHRVEFLVGGAAASKAEYSAILVKVAQRDSALKEALSMVVGGSPTFDEAESLHIFALCGTQQTYRELASKLWMKFKDTVLVPIYRLVARVDSQVSEAVYEVVELIIEGDAKKCAKSEP